ncbi:hypothetical protein E2I00_013662, partial [Balaenoptera physalus]
ADKRVTTPTNSRGRACAERSRERAAGCRARPLARRGDVAIRTLGYCCQLVGGVLVEQCPARSEVGTRLLALSSQLSHCRTVLRLFDDVAMFEEAIFVRCVSVLGNLTDQLYYPCEHVPVDGPEAETEAEEPPGSLHQHSLPCPCGRLPQGKRRAAEAQIRSEALTLLSNVADLANAVHWLPPGILWAGRLPPWLVGLLGTISSLLSMYQAVGAGGQAYAAP